MDDKTWNFEKDEMLIELVKNKRSLYDLQSPYYSDNYHKKNAWYQIEKELGQSGAKFRWESLRSQYRKYLNRQKTKSGQAASTSSKWRFQEQMSFLHPFVSGDRPRISSIENEDNNGNSQEECGVNRESEQNSPHPNVDAEEATLPNICANSFTNETPPIKKRKRTTDMEPKDSASATLMKYILQKKEKESSAHPIEAFFSLMGATVKNFTPVDQHFIKTKVFALVSQVEEKYLASSSTVLPMSSINHPHHESVVLSPTYYQSSSSSPTHFNENVQFRSQAYREQQHSSNFVDNCTPYSSPQ